MNQELYEQLPQIRAEKKKADEEKREYERKCHEEQQKKWDDFYKQYTSGSYSIGSSSNYTDKEKEYLKKSATSPTFKSVSTALILKS